jgi:hypothetical protein
MNSTSAMLLARARQDELLRAAERLPQRHSPTRGPKPAGRRIELPRWFRFPRLAGSRT